MNEKYDVIIIGGGPAGYTAAMYCARAGLSALVIERLGDVGQMAQIARIDNYPGFDGGIDGYTLAMNMRGGARRFGADTLGAEVVSAELEGREKRVEAAGGVFTAKAVIIATGAEARPLGLDRERELTGKGVSYCASCDGNFYRGKIAAVVGGGNSAAGDAIMLAAAAKKVYLIHRRDYLRASEVYRRALMQADNIELKWNSTVSKLLGSEKLTGVMLRDVNSGKETELELDGLFVSIGRTPATKLFANRTELDGQGCIIADETTRTCIPGVFAAGDVRTKEVRQIVTAAADGAAAAYYAEKYILEGV